RMAVREQVRISGAWPNHIRDSELVADIALGVPNKEAARFLLRHLEAVASSAEIDRFAEHITRHGDDSMVSALVGLARKHSSKRLRAELADFQAIERGLAARGGKISGELRE